MDDVLSPQFQSYQGLHRIITTKSALQDSLRGIVEWLKKNGQLIQPNNKHLSIKLLDTFFSDSLDDDVLSSLFGLSQLNKYPIKILMLDPFSEFAISRAHALKTSSVKELNIALFNIRNAINLSLGKRILKRNTPENKFDDFDFIIDQLGFIREMSNEFTISIRFYEVFTEAPVYIISQFLAKGLILHGHTAAQNPWMIFVDNITQQRDIYDFLNDNFDWVWEDSKNEPTMDCKFPISVNSTSETPIFFSHGRNELATLKIQKFVTISLREEIMLFEEQSKPGLTTIENLEELISKCGKAIILLTKEDEQLGGGLRARQNVIHELGYCQSRYGRSNVLLLVEDGVEYPSNINGITYIKFSMDNIEGCYEDIRRKLS
ncbi:MAG: nucleotide-binding protein [Gallionellaceae bacterium]